MRLNRVVTVKINEQMPFIGKERMFELHQLKSAFIYLFLYCWIWLSFGQMMTATGVALTRKNCVFYAKKSRLRKYDNAVRLLYAKHSDLTHQNAFRLFVFCTQQRRFVEHLPWV